MIRLRGTVQYAGGSSVPFEAGTAALAEWELYAHRHELPTSPTAMPSLSSLVVACYAVNGTLEGFEAWRATVVDVDLELPEGAAAPSVPPTLREASGA